MKVISQKIKDVQSMWPKRVFCDECQAELEIEESDVFVGEFGCYLFKCPCCGRKVALDGIERDTPPTFKQTFLHIYDDKSNNTKHIKDDEIQKMINHCVSNLISDDVEAGEFSMQGYGDTVVYAFKYEDCIEILVTQDYYNDTLFDDDYGLIRKED